MPRIHLQSSRLGQRWPHLPKALTIWLSCERYETSYFQTLPSILGAIRQGGSGYMAFVRQGLKTNPVTSQPAAGYRLNRPSN